MLDEWVWMCPDASFEDTIVLPYDFWRGGGKVGRLTLCLIILVSCLSIELVP